MLKKVFEFVARMNVQFLACVLEMVLDRPDAEMQLARNLIIAPVVSRKPGDFLLSHRQSIPQSLRFRDFGVGRDLYDLDGELIRGNPATPTVDPGRCEKDQTECGDEEYDNGLRRIRREHTSPEMVVCRFVWSATCLSKTTVSNVWSLPIILHEHLCYVN
jgi:hypothetical protein